MLKLAGRIEVGAGGSAAGPAPGQLRLRFEGLPDLPLGEIEVHVREGPRAPLTTPQTCGEVQARGTFASWSAPQVPAASAASSFAITVGAGGGACPSAEEAEPNAPELVAGTTDPLAGAYSPFFLRLSRPDGSRRLGSFSFTLPPGLLARLAGTAQCPDAALAAARARAAGAEEASPSCPSSAQVGEVQIAAGPGPTPLELKGRVYLAGPYKGAPFSFVFIVPAVAGPFDLGTVVDRVAVYVGEYDARPRAVADPLPTIRDGIPLDVRSIEVKLDRPSFTLNPTSCEVKAIEGSVTTQAGQTAPLKNRFQVGECGRLAFKPSLKLSLKGATKRTGHPALKAVVTYPQQGEYANIARAQVNLPHSEFLDQGNIGKACTKVLLAQQACPAKSIYGKVKLWTPLLDKPLEGPVYLAGGYGYKLPALVAELNGQIRVLLVGKVDTGKNKGIRNTFEAAPDAPVSRFILEMKGGKEYGLLENSENICHKKQKAGVSFTAQNGAVDHYKPVVTNQCRKGKHHKKSKRSHSKTKGQGTKSRALVHRLISW